METNTTLDAKGKNNFVNINPIKNSAFVSFRFLKFDTPPKRKDQKYVIVFVSRQEKSSTFRIWNPGG